MKKGLIINTNIYPLRFSVKYGDLLYINTVALRIVVLNSCESIRQAFQNQHISDRPAIQVLKHTIEGDGKFIRYRALKILFCSSKEWISVFFSSSS